MMFQLFNAPNCCICLDDYSIHFMGNSYIFDNYPKKAP